MTTPDIYQDEDSGDLDVFVPPEFTGALIEFLRGKVPFFGVTIEAAGSFDEDEEVDTSDDAEVAPPETTDEEEDKDDDETSEPLDAFSFPGDVDEAELSALLEEFFAAR